MKRIGVKCIIFTQSVDIIVREEERIFRSRDIPLLCNADKLHFSVIFVALIVNKAFLNFKYKFVLKLEKSKLNNISYQNILYLYNNTIIIGF